MASIIEQPKPIVTAGNIVPLKVIANTGIISSGNFAMELDFTAAPAVNAQFKFRWNNQPKEYWITITNTPPFQSATEFRGIGGSESLANYLADLSSFFNKVFALSEEFIFEKHATLNRIIVNARYAGQYYNLELISPIPSGLTVTRSPVSDVTNYEYYRIVSEVYEVNGTNLIAKLIGRDTLPFQEGGQLFDLSEYLVADFNAFDQALNTYFQVRTDLMKEFAVRASESVGVPPAFKAFTNAISFLALPGKLPDWYQRERDVSARNFFDPPTYPFVPFLSNCTERKTAPGLSHRLFFQADAASPLTTIAIYTEAWLKGANSPFSELGVTTDDFSRRNLYEINLDWDFLEANLQSVSINSTVPDYFLCYISEPDDPTAFVSEVVKIEVDKEQRFSKLAFRYRNMFGVYDDLLCTGHISESTDFNKEESIRTTRTGSNQRAKSRLYTHSSESVVKTKVSTGFTEDIRMLDVFRDFIESKEIYLQKDGEMIPVKVFTTSTKDIDQGSRLYSLEFEFAITGIENSYYNA